MAAEHTHEPPDPPIPVTVIGGYLGAGKTTLVNHVLRHAQGLRLAVLVNDFGALPIDADLIQSRDGNVIGIAGGCVCCSYGSDLMHALMDLETRRPRPDHVLLETSGVALPGQVAAALTLLASYAIDAVVTLADAETVRRHGSDRYLADTIGRQLEDAHLILLNKADLVSPSELDDVERWLADRAPRARVLRVRQAAAPIEIVLGHRLGFASDPAQPHAHHDDHAYATATLACVPVADARAIADALLDPGLGILRAKGVVEQAEGSAWVVQVVGAHAYVTPASGNAAQRRGLVVIGLKDRLNIAGLEAKLGAALASRADVRS